MVSTRELYWDGAGSGGDGGGPVAVIGRGVAYLVGVVLERYRAEIWEDLYVVAAWLQSRLSDGFAMLGEECWRWIRA